MPSSGQHLNFSNTSVPISLSYATILSISIEVETHRLVDTFAEDGKHEDSRNGWCEVAGNGLDVVEELTTLG